MAMHGRLYWGRRKGDSRAERCHGQKRKARGTVATQKRSNYNALPQIDRRRHVRNGMTNVGFSKVMVSPWPVVPADPRLRRATASSEPQVWMVWDVEPSLFQKMRNSSCVLSLLTCANPPAASFHGFPYCMPRHLLFETDDGRLDRHLWSFRSRPQWHPQAVCPSKYGLHFL